MTPSEKNLGLYARYVFCANAIFWLPLFFLYMSQVLTVSEVLLLEALYYMGVVFLEVPAGVFSDRVGRRATLMSAGFCGAIGGLCFFFFQSFVGFCIAQLFFAAWAALRSGTENALLYDSLKNLEREDEYLEHEARAEGLLRKSVGLACIVGGLCAAIDLRVPYLLFAIMQLGAAGVAFGFREPVRAAQVKEKKPLAHVRQAFSHASVRWVFLFTVFMTLIDHVPYEFLQSYLELLFGPTGVRAWSNTPALAGVIMALCMFIAAGFSSKAQAFDKRFGSVNVLLLTLILQGLLIALMAFFVHVTIAALLVFRSVAPALHRPISLSMIQPRIDSEVRATVLSMQSFFGRLLFGASLLCVSFFLEGRELGPQSLQRVLLGFLVFTLVALLSLVLLRPRGGVQNTL